MAVIIYFCKGLDKLKWVDQILEEARAEVFAEAEEAVVTAADSEEEEAVAVVTVADSTEPVVVVLVAAERPVEALEEAEVVPEVEWAQLKRLS